MIQHFLLVFDHARGELVEIEEFGTDASKAIEAYDAKERGLLSDTRMEVVLIGSDSLETIRTTHANYFDGGVPVSKYFDLTTAR